MQALILAGGEGTRLRPLTGKIPKPVVPLAGRPHIVYVIDWLARHGVDDVVVSCGFLADEVRGRPRRDRPGLRIRFVDGARRRGAPPARSSSPRTSSATASSSSTATCSATSTWARWSPSTSSTGARATIALYPVEDPSAYGLVRRDEDGEVTEFLEKPDPDPRSTRTRSTPAPTCSSARCST